jgi:hypothetical protein
MLLLALLLVALFVGFGYLRATARAEGLPPSVFLPLMLLPESAPPLPEFTLQITPEGGINASTYNANSFRLGNHPASGQRITQVRLDLSTGLFPKMVYDPYGIAGDLVAKDLAIDFDAGVGFAGHAYEGFRDDGYDILVLNFTNFDPGEQFNFSVDVDPTSIRGVGAPGPGESGSVSGLEVIGATATVSFEGGLVLTGQSYHMQSSTSGSQLTLRQGLPDRPTIEILGIPGLPATVADPNQVVRISGPAGQYVRLLVVQGALFTAGLPGGGFNIEPYDANSALEPGLQEYRVFMPGNSIDIPILLHRTQPEGGLNYITAAFENSYGMLGFVAEPAVLELQN